jgi:menaquinone-dependent protoporphyrinogen oxidase
MKVLVAYASRHGATQGIAERIAATLARHGLVVELQRAERVGSVDRYDAVVIGAAAYMGRWLKEATELVRWQADALRRRPVWLFSSGPIGPEQIDKKGRDVLEATRPRDFGELAQLIEPRETRVFFGAFDPDAAPVGVAERIMAMTPARRAMPAGDFRDWPAIEAWADGIAAALRAEPVAVG